MASNRAFGWLGPIGGILFAVLLVIAFVVAGGGPEQASMDDSAATIATELEETRDESSASFPLFGLSVVFFIFFLAYLRDRFRRAGEEGAWLVSAFWAAGLLFAATFLLQGFVQAAQFTIEDYGRDVQVAKALFALGWESILVMGPPLVVFGATTAMLVLRFKVLPLWLGAVAVLVFLGGFVPWMGAPILALWVLLTSLALLLEGGRRPAAATA